LNGAVSLRQRRPAGIARAASIGRLEVAQTMDVAITVLGGFGVTVGGTVVDPAEWRRRHAAALVKLLALSPHRSLHREQVMDALWPGLSVDEAAPRLHKAAHFARRAIDDPHSVVLADESVALFPGREIVVDVQRFQQLAESALSRNDQDLAAAAVDSYGGELLPQDVYESWAQDARDRLHVLYLDVLRLAGRWEQLTIVDPTDEDAHLHVITDLARRGERRAALRQFERLESALSRELGVALSPSAAELRARLRADGPSTPEQPSPLPAPSLPVLVGGSADRALLAELLDTVQSGRGRSLFLAGPPGIGKTAKLAWLEHAATGRRMRVGTGVAARVEGAWPYAPVLEALADLCRRHPALLDGLDDLLRAEIEGGLSGREISWTAERGHQRLFVAAAELLRLAAAGAGAVLVVDDAHQADDGSVRLMHYLARSSVSERVLLVLAHRPDVTAELAQIRQSLLGRGTAVTLDLRPLDRDDAAALVREVAPAASDDFVDAVWTASGGVPFSVVELARARAGRSSPAAAALLPQTWNPETWDDGHLDALGGAAVLGSAFDTDEFLEISGLGEDDAYAALDAGLANGLLVRTPTGYEFRQHLLREALLDRLRPTQLRTLHRRAAAALEALGRSPARIGHHLVQAGERAAAVSWMIRAAETSAAYGAYQDAVATLESVRDRAEGPDLARLDSLFADLLMAKGDAGAVQAYRVALGRATDRAERSRLRARLARAATLEGDLDTATIALDGLTPDGSSGDTELLLAQGNLALFRGDLEAADRAAAEARRRVTLGRPDEWQMFDLISLQGLVAHTRGEWFQRLRMELRYGARNPALAARIFDSHLCVAEFLLYGPTPYPEVLELASSLRDTAERSGLLRAVGFATALRGETALLMGDLDTAEAELTEAVDLHRDIGSAAGEAHSLQRLAEVRIAQGDRAGAGQLLHRALPLARFSIVAMHILQRIYGTMIVAADDPQAARAVVDHAEAALGVADQCTFCTVMLAIPAAQACADVGDLDDARRHLRAAQESVRLWEGTSWQAALLEAESHIAGAADDVHQAARLRRAAADLFEAAGQRLDAERCRSAAVLAGR
jgi:DNA-binding SARP family transcriptional activator/tetratricopeptide (TPR) repeat protein